MNFNNQAVWVLPIKQTWLSAIERNNWTGRTIVPNAFYNCLFLRKDALNKFNPIPEDIMRAQSLYTGTAAVIGARGKALGKYVQSECKYEFSEKMKTVIFKPEAGQEGLVDVMLLSRHGFASDGRPLIQLVDARTNQPIISEEDLDRAEEVFVKFNGSVRSVNIIDRKFGTFEKVGDEITYISTLDSPVVGLLARSTDNRRFVGLMGSSTGALEVGVYPHELTAADIAKLGGNYSSLEE